MFYKLWVLDSGMRTKGYWIEGGLNKASAEFEVKKLKALGYIVAIFKASGPQTPADN